MADDPNKELLPQILAILGAERVSDETPNPVSSEHKGIIKDSIDKKPKELPANLTSNEEGRVRNIGKVLAVAIGQELQIGKYAPGPEAGRLSMKEKKIGSAVNIPKPPEKNPAEALKIPEWIKWAGILGGIAAAAEALYDDLGAIGRFLTKAAFKLGRWIDAARALGRGISGIGRAIKNFFKESKLGKFLDDLKAFKLGEFLDDLKAKFPKTAEFIGEFKKKWAAGTALVKEKWYKFLDDLLFEKLPKDVQGPRQRTRLGRAIDRVKGWWSKSLDAILYEKLPKGAGRDKTANRLQQAARRISKWYDSLFIDVRAIKVDGQWVDDTKYTKLGERVAAIKNWWRNTVDRITNISWLTKSKQLNTVADAADTQKSLTKLFLESTGELSKAFFDWAGDSIKGILGIGKEGGGLWSTITAAFKNSAWMAKLAKGLKFLPVIGGFFNIGFAIARYKKGEIFKGTLELLAGILDIIGIFLGPGAVITSGISMALDGFLLISDLQEDQAAKQKAGTKPFSGGFFSDLADGFMMYIAPILKYVPVIGSLFYFGEAYTAFREKNWGKGFLKLGQGLLSLTTGPLGSAINLGIDVILSFTTDKAEGQETKDEASKGGFFVKLKKWVYDWVVPVLRYLPVLGSIFYFADANTAFTRGDMFNGIDNILKGLIAFVGGKGLVDLVNYAYPIIVGFFTDKEENTEAESVSGKKEGGFWNNLKKAIADYILPILKYVPVVGAFFYGKEAWDAFSSKQWSTGFLKTGQALIALAGGPLGSAINLGIDFITSIFDAEQTQEQEVKTQGGGFTAMIKGAFDALVGIITGAIDSMINWVKNAFADITVSAAEGVNAAMAKIPGGKYITAAGEWLAEKAIPEVPSEQPKPMVAPGIPAGLPPEQEAHMRRVQGAAAKYGYKTPAAAAKAAGFRTPREWDAAGLPKPTSALAQAAAPVATSSMVAAPAQQPSTFMEAAGYAAAPPSVAAPTQKQQPETLTQAAAPPSAAAPTQNTNTATGAMTAGIMSTFGITNRPTPPAGAQPAGMPPLEGGTQARNFKGGQGEAYALARSLAARAGSPDPDTTASIVMLESGWLKSSMVRRANNPSGQTITKGQIGKNGIIGGTVGGDGQLHAVYANLETAFAHHVRRWGSRYVPNDVFTTTRNLVAGGYNTVNPAWASHVQNTYRRWSGKQLPAIAQETLSGAAPTAAMAAAPAATSSQTPVSMSFMQASAPAAAPQMPESTSMSASAPVSMDSLSAAAAPSASIPSPVPGGFDQYFNSPAFGAALAARGNIGARQVGGSWKSSSGTTLCAAGAMVVAGMYTKSDAIKKARIGSATNLARNPNNPLTSTGIYKDLGGLPSNYRPVDGDLVAMAGGSKGFGHALVYIGGKWYAHKSGDRTPQQYLSSGKYNSPRLYRLSQAAAATAGVPDEIAASGSGISSYASPSISSEGSTATSSGGLFSGMSNFFTSGGATAQSADGGIANLSTSSAPAPMAAAGAESSITSKMDDIASRHISKADEEIGILKGIDESIKELTKQISALSRVTINNVSGEGGKTSIASANIPDTDTRLRPQTSGGFLGGKMFGFG